MHRTSSFEVYISEEYRNNALNSSSPDMMQYGQQAMKGLIVKVIVESITLTLNSLNI